MFRPTLDGWQKAARLNPNGLRRLAKWLKKDPSGDISDVVYRIWDGKR